MPRTLDDWLARIEENHPNTIELGLQRCAEVWQRMGRPRPAPRVITVAGTNGKGSTVAGIEAAMLHIGRQTGCYTSPHLLHFGERIRINGQDSSERAIIEGFRAVESAQQDTRLTYFEFVTLGAIATMHQANLDVAVLEVGLGGRLDAVNVIDADFGVITAIGIDHQEYLGNDRESIGYEKSGIMRADQTLVCSDREPPESVFDAAASIGARLIRIGADFEVSRDRSTRAAEWKYYFADESVDFPVSAQKPHLADNLAGALTAVITSEPPLQSRLKELAVVVAKARVRGRLEQVASNPDVIVDVGHNPLAAGAIREFLKRRGSQSCRIVLAMLADKDAEGVASILGDRVGSWYCAGLAGSRGQSGANLAKRVRQALPVADVEAFDNVPGAIGAALEGAGEHETVLVFGSFVTASEAIGYLARA